MCVSSLIAAAQAWPFIFATDLARYLIAATLVFVIVWKLFARRLEPRRIQVRRPGARDFRREVLTSLRSVLLFSINGAAIFFLASAGIADIYSDSETYGLLWFALSFPLIIVAHDAYFYWLHRAMHRRGLFRVLHSTHHKSLAPTPWAAYAFNVGEAIGQALFTTFYVLLLPTHQLVLAVFLIHMITRNVIGHCGYEIFPAWWLRSPLTRWITTVSHHDLHHQNGRYNFGLYFTWWDSLCGTEHPEYAAEFNRAAGGEFERSALDVL